jgi:excinuclease ABC subunit C
MKDVKARLAALPAQSGVYIFLDEYRDILYVGKAKSLKNRVKQYFQTSAVNTAKTMALVSRIDDFRYIITHNELEALVLENNLIKKHQPPYNILLKDDKTYPYIKINVKEPFPRVEGTRKIKKDGARYFGPFLLGVRIKDILELIHFAFPLRSCSDKLPKKNGRECLNFHIKRCLAPCTGRVTEEEYAEIINKVIAFLNGDDKEIERILKEKMLSAAEKEEFELAKMYRDGLELLAKITRKQITALPNNKDMDLFTIASSDTHSVINIMIFRGGKLLGSENFPYNSVETDLSSYIIQYYQINSPRIDEILLMESIQFSEQLSEWLREKAGKTVRIIVPKKGEKKRLVELSYNNALEYLNKQQAKIESKLAQTGGAVAELKERLNLPAPPRRIECYDISNISGTDKVASMVVFVNGEKHAKSYRRFKIKTVEGADDFASIREALARRTQRYKEGGAGFEQKPDLVVIDGGKGQLSSALAVAKGLDAPIIGLAKAEEEIYTPECDNPIRLPRDSYALKLLQRVRDEAHRFALAYHQSLREKRMLSSRLTQIEGVGERFALLLLDKFKSIENIKNASVKELCEIPGLGEKRAKAIAEYLKNN